MNHSQKKPLIREVFLRCVYKVQWCDQSQTAGNLVTKTNVHTFTSETNNFVKSKKKGVKKKPLK